MYLPSENKLGSKESGSVLPLIALAMLSMTGGVWVLGMLTADLGDRTKAQTAADAAALAAVVGGEDTARVVADANSATWVSVRENNPGDVTIHVRVGRHVASARAIDGIIHK